MFFESDYKILSNEKIAKDVYKMRLEGDTSHITAPGQFVNIKLDGKFLRRPISVCDCEENVITIIYKVVGEGTEQMSNLKIGKMLNVLTGLGNGYDISKSTKPLLIGGGVGVPPMYFLAKKLIESVDGSYGVKGFVTDAFPDDYDYFYTCGPLPMFKAVYDKTQCSGQFSFEERMGCGFGVCMGCSCKTKYGNKRICKDGPVLVKEEIIW